MARLAGLRRLRGLLCGVHALAVVAAATGQEMNIHWQARLFVALAAVLWSLSGLFITLLTKPNGWLGDLPPVAAEQIACWRCLFGAASLLVLFRLPMLRWHPLLPVMAACFAIMNGLFVLAMSLGDVAEAALLQYT